MGFASHGTHQTKQRTIDGVKVRITNRTWYGNHIGYHIRIGDEPKIHFNGLTWEEAFAHAEKKIRRTR